MKNLARYLKGIVLMGSLLLAFVVNATESASLMTFSTEGPDCYADGTTVLDGEYYALVYQTAAAGDVCFTLNGEIACQNAAGETITTNDAVILRALARASGGRCPSTTFAVESAKLPKLSSTGKMRLYLLDTRIYEDGTARVGGLASVQASVPVSTIRSITTSSATGLKSSDFVASLLPFDVESPRITDIRVCDGLVTLTVEGTYDGVNYTSEDPFGTAAGTPVSPVTGKRGVKVNIVVPCGEAASGFYRVKRQ